MRQAPIWFERKFEFTFPVEVLPNLCTRLRGTPARLEETLRGRSPERLLAKPKEKWSAQEHAGHLLDLEPLWLSRVDDYVQASDQLTAADLNNRKTEEANHNTRSLQTAEACRRTGPISLCTSYSSPAPKNANALGRSFIFCCRTRRSSSRKYLGPNTRRSSALDFCNPLFARTALCILESVASSFLARLLLSS
jgi:hypothetical protein